MTGGSGISVASMGSSEAATRSTTGRSSSILPLEASMPSSQQEKTDPPTTRPRV